MKAPKLRKAKWPELAPRPSFEDIRLSALHILDAPYDLDLGKPVPKLDGIRRRPTLQPSAVLARQLIAVMCRSIRGMSTPEIAEAIGCGAHSWMTDRRNWSRKLLESDAGTAMYNAAMDDLRERVGVKA